MTKVALIFTAVGIVAAFFVAGCSSPSADEAKARESVVTPEKAKEMGLPSAPRKKMPAAPGN